MFGRSLGARPSRLAGWQDQPMARRYEPVPFPPRETADSTAIVPSAICGGCEISVQLVDGALPPGWIEQKDCSVPSGNAALCGACRPSAASVGLAGGEGRSSQAEPEARKRCGTADETPPSDLIPGCTFVSANAPQRRLYGGFRMIHWNVGNHVVLRVHGGELPRPGRRDDPVHFLADAEVLDKMIIHLSEIRAQLASKAADHV